MFSSGKSQVPLSCFFVPSSLTSYPVYVILNMPVGYGYASSKLSKELSGIVEEPIPPPPNTISFQHHVQISFFEEDFL